MRTTLTSRLVSTLRPLPSRFASLPAILNTFPDSPTTLPSLQRLHDIFKALPHGDPADLNSPNNIKHFIDFLHLHHDPSRLASFTSNDDEVQQAISNLSLQLSTLSGQVHSPPLPPPNPLTDHYLTLQSYLTPLPPPPDPLHPLNTTLLSYLHTPTEPTTPTHPSIHLHYYLGDPENRATHLQTASDLAATALSDNPVPLTKLNLLTTLGHCYLEAESAVTAEGLLSTALDVKEEVLAGGDCNMNAPSFLQLHDVRRRLYARWDRREADAAREEGVVAEVRAGGGWGDVKMEEAGVVAGLRCVEVEYDLTGV